MAGVVEHVSVYWCSKRYICRHDEQKYLEGRDVKFVIWQLLSPRETNINVAQNLDQLARRLFNKQIAGRIVLVAAAGSRSPAPVCPLDWARETA